MKPVGKYDVLLNLATGMTNLWDYGISGTKMDQSLHSLSYGRSSVTVTIQGTECQENNARPFFSLHKKSHAIRMQ